MRQNVTGAVIIGGDYQGLGIARSLGRRNVPVCVIDDEISIGRSRATTHAVAVPSLRDERQTADAILEIGRRVDLKGWVICPTRDETVAALARYRPRLAEYFRVPTPPSGRSSCRCWRLSERFLRAINYYGLVELEYKLDPRDGQYKLLDVKGRTWGYQTLGLGAWVDFPYMLFADQVGESVESRRGRTGVSWVRLFTDVPTGVLEILAGRQDFRAYLGSIRRFHIESVFSREDPLLALLSLPFCRTCR